MDILSKVKLQLGITDATEDALLNSLIEDSELLINEYLGTIQVPTNFKGIVKDLSIKAYRKIGSEGLKAEQIDVISNTFEDADPLAPYYKLLDEYKQRNRKLRMI